MNNKWQYLDAMGIQVWVQREPAILTTPIESANPSPPAIVNDVAVGDDNLLDWDALQHKVAACTACELHKTRKQTVFGVGDRQADWLLIGEAPGAEEDRQGEPFVGRAGQLLNAMLLAIGLKREEVYIANILKCRPPGNRDPQPEEVQQCEAFLKRQVELIKPKIILALGRIAAQNLLKTDINIGRLRGKRFSYGEHEIPLVVTYHPAYLLRTPVEKRKAWDDLRFAVAVCKEYEDKPFK